MERVWSTAETCVGQTKGGDGRRYRSSWPVPGSPSSLPDTSGSRRSSVLHASDLRPCSVEYLRVCCEPDSRREVTRHGVEELVLEVTESLAEIGGTLTFGPTKTHAARKVPLPPSIAAMLSEHVDERVGAAPDSLLFTSARGFPIRYSRFRPTIWVPTLHALGLPLVGMHSLRHSAAARMIGAQWQAIDVQRALGHRSAAFTLSAYGHLFDEHLDDLASALDGTSRGTGAVQPITSLVENSL